MGYLRSWQPAVHTIFFVMMIGEAVAQDRCADLDPTTDAVGYQVRTDDERCEGFYRSPIRDAAIEIVSLTLGSVLYNLETDHSLTVSVPQSLGTVAGEINIRSVALPLGVYYRMDARVASGGAMTWPLDHILKPAKLGAAAIGIFGWIGEGKPELYMPVAVAVESNKTPPVASRSDGILLSLRFPVDVDTLQWRFWVDGKERELDLSWRSGVAQGLRTGETATLTIPDGESAVLILEIAVRRADTGEWRKRKIRLLRP